MAIVRDRCYEEKVTENTNAFKRLRVADLKIELEGCEFHSNRVVPQTYVQYFIGVPDVLTAVAN
jgi:hypothetical protein